MSPISVKLPHWHLPIGSTLMPAHTSDYDEKSGAWHQADRTGSDASALAVCLDHRWSAFSQCAYPTPLSCQGIHHLKYMTDTMPMCSKSRIPQPKLY
eukprot:UN19911